MPGLLLATGRFPAAKAMLLGLASRAHNGMIPTEFPEDASKPPLYSGADTSLWFINAVWHYLRYTGDEATVQQKLLDQIVQIIRAYQHGASPGIVADANGLLVC